MKTEKNISRISEKGFTLLEILTVVVIIAILVGILMPALNMVRKMGNDVKQKAQLASIEIGLNLYKNDLGDYPQSHGVDNIGTIDYKYCGAQTLSEAMFGRDLLGFDPNSKFDAADDTEYDSTIDLKTRKGPYLDRTHINVLTAENIYGTGITAIEKDLFLICDVYTRAKKYVTLPNGSQIKATISTPVLYYKANTSKEDNNITSPSATDTYKNIYDSWDNEELISLLSVGSEKTKYKHHFDKNYSEDRSSGVTLSGREIFYEFIQDKMTSTTTPLKNRPVRPDTFLLISAGFDGLYGTSDDICNFEPNIE
ncbi:MAG: hypothetical protein A2Y12_15785 [Planctomycetes bacterium GWF2_42_9]|nr:MAG: hypothetical protein A2Y12_15785 [Planctomycetes bacterium GWF2_42_9]HAL44374.1 hypothetical protein [Phycisphaerales bacterium]